MLNFHFRDMTIVERLEFILAHPDICGPKKEGTPRSSYLTIALDETMNILPPGKGKRALEYVARNNLAEFHFGGTDAVGPAIKEAIKLLTERRAA